MAKLIKLGIGFLLIPTAFAFGYEALLYITDNLDALLRNWFTYGFAAYVFLRIVLLGFGNARFWETFEHELTHTVMSALFLRPIFEYHVEATGEGSVKAIGLPGVDWLIGLAPYFLPLFTIPLLAIALIFPSLLPNLIHGLIGASLAFHYFALVVFEFRLAQPDIQKNGIVFSSIITVLFNVVFLIITLAIVLDDTGSIRAFLQGAFDQTKNAYSIIIEATRSFLQSA